MQGDTEWRKLHQRYDCVDTVNGGYIDASLRTGNSASVLDGQSQPGGNNMAPWMVIYRDFSFLSLSRN